MIRSFFRFISTQLFEQIGGIEKLERLQEHENEEVYKQVFNILEVYFSDVSIAFVRLGFISGFI